MDIIEELKYYCNEPSPIGALMITGEWGCGKTYLINNILKEELKDTHVVLCVSLFGMSSIEDVRKEVKRCWLYLFAESKGITSDVNEKAEKYGKVIKTVIDKSLELVPKPLKAVAGSISSLNILDFVKINSEFENKKVVLVFDDLERATISTSDLLGCINDYCENFHINTIVVTNEKKIQSTEIGEIKYDEIKEKIIQRTICYIPNYSVVVSNVIKSMVYRKDGASQAYRAFLEKNEQNLSDVFENTSNEDMLLKRIQENDFRNSGETFEEERKKVSALLKQRPHNIRSFKCAIQDFERIYRILDEKQIESKEKWLFTYLAYVLTFRAGLIPENERYGTLLSDENVSILYPGFYNNKCITNAIKQWIRHGEWNQKLLEEELDYEITRNKAIAPEEKVRMYRLLELEEMDVKVGYPVLLEKAYAGEIELNDYVNLIWNSCWARKYNISIPNIEWEKICDGIHEKIKKMLERKQEQPSYQRGINKEDEKNFHRKEWDAYMIIDEFWHKKVLIIEKNKEIYISLIKIEPLNALEQTQTKRYDCFNIEMAEATVEGFKKTLNKDKESFVNYFEKMWKYNMTLEDYDMEISKGGYVFLKTEIEKFKDKCIKEGLDITKVYADEFLNAINELLDEIQDN